MLTAITCYPLVGLLGYVSGRFGLEMIDSATDEANIPFSLAMSALLWPLPFARWVMSMFHPDDE